MLKNKYYFIYFLLKFNNGVYILIEYFKKSSAHFD